MYCLQRHGTGRKDHALPSQMPSEQTAGFRACAIGNFTVWDMRKHFPSYVSRKHDISVVPTAFFHLNYRVIIRPKPFCNISQVVTCSLTTHDRPSSSLAAVPVCLQERTGGGHILYPNRKTGRKADLADSQLWEGCSIPRRAAAGRAGLPMCGNYPPTCEQS